MNFNEYLETENASSEPKSESRRAFNAFVESLASSNAQMSVNAVMWNFRLSIAVHGEGGLFVVTNPDIPGHLWDEWSRERLAERWRVFMDTPARRERIKK
jgi:hypothetical protein